MSIYGKRPTTTEEASLFWDYFSVADETFTIAGRHNLTLDDIDSRYVRRAKEASDKLDLPWPPYLPHAEEYALDYGSTLDLLRRMGEVSR